MNQTETTLRAVGRTADVPFRTWLAFAAMCLGMFMAILDIQIVTTSLPAIRAALKIPTDKMIWIQTAYLTAEIVAIPLTGYLTRLMGMRWLFVIATAVFTAASVGCAASSSFAVLIGWRVIQGFAGGTLIPAVFSAIFLLFPERAQGLATTIAGVAAVLAPTVGPIAGGYITQTWSWHWLFLINVLPGILAATGTGMLLSGKWSDWHVAGRIDLMALVIMAAGLVALQLGLKDAPALGWGSSGVALLLGGSLVAIALFIWRTWNSADPLVELRFVNDRNFAIGCALSFLLGVGLFGMSYLMPFFLGIVRGHGSLRIGEIMLVTGLAQLASAPLAVMLERKVDARALTAFGFALFAAGQLISTQQTQASDAAQMVLPQILRGAASMFCLLPPTRLALGRIKPELVADASGVFNLMRNLGGAIGLALIDTVIFSRSTTYGQNIADQLRAGNVGTAVSIGIPRDAFLENLGQPVDEFTTEMVRPLVEKAALAHAVNDAWLLLGGASVLAVMLVLFVRKVGPQQGNPAA